MVNGVIVKVGGDGLGGHIVGRVLHWSEGIDHLSQGKDHDAAGVLASGAPYAHAALYDPVDLAVSLPLPMLLKIVLHIAEGRLVRQGADGPCPEGLALSKDHLRVIVGAALVFSGEV